MRVGQFGPHWSSSIGSMLWLYDFLSECGVSSPFQGKIPLTSRSRFQDNARESEQQKSDDIRLLLLKLGLLTVRHTETDPKTLMRTGVLGVPNMYVSSAFSFRKIT